MADTNDIPMVQPAGPNDLPPRHVVYALHPRPSLLTGIVGWFFRTLILVSLLLNVIFYYMFTSSAPTERLPERHYLGEANAKDKVALIRIQSVILEGFIHYATQQIKDAAQDDSVKAVIIAVNSPGGSVTASDLLHKFVKDLRDGKWPKQKSPKPVVVMMESIAASGGYYVSAPAQKIIAQPTTITGSIGVYAAFLDLHKAAEKYGVDLTVIKKGELKGASMFKEMSVEERREWDGLMEHAYQRFMGVVKDGRGTKLKHGLRDEIKIKTDSGEPLVRRLADGGVFTSDQAKEFGLVDDIGYVEDAVAAAKKLASLSTANVITYDRPVSFAEALIGLKERTPEAELRLENLPGATARLWFLAPGHELAGIQMPFEALRLGRK